VRILVDEMYPAGVAEALRAINIEATTLAALRLAGASDAEVFGAAVAGRHAVLTENVGDFARIAAEHSTAGGHHPGVLIALSSRFSRRPAGTQPLIAAIRVVADEEIEDRVIYLERPSTASRSRPPVRAKREYLRQPRDARPARNAGADRCGVRGSWIWSSAGVGPAS
jgi:predicted nuclease of predicted toxin-antitoxin system